MVTRAELVAFLDALLEVPHWESIDASRNGLQVSGREEGTLVLGATDASRELSQIAREREAFFVVVHHGLFWADFQRVDAIIKGRLAPLFEGDVNLYAVHLPLDAHATLGNNAQLLKRMGATHLQPFGMLRGRAIGFRGQLPLSRPFDALAQDLQGTLGISAADLTLMKHGPEITRYLGVVSGTASAALVAEAASAGVDTLLVGEAGHTFYHPSREYAVNIIAGGHYATETWGVRALLDATRAKFPDLETHFVELPTGY